MPATKRRPDTVPPVSSIYVVEHKLGYKQVIGCRVCDVVLDLNHCTPWQRQMFVARHEHCVTGELLD